MMRNFFKRKSGLMILGLLIVASCGKNATKECKPVVYEPDYYQKSSLESKTYPVIFEQISDEAEFKFKVSNSFSNFKSSCIINQDGSFSIVEIDYTGQAAPYAYAGKITEEEVTFLREQLNQTLHSKAKFDNELSDADCDGFQFMDLTIAEPNSISKQIPIKKIPSPYCEHGHYQQIKEIHHPVDGVLTNSCNIKPKPIPMSIQVPVHPMSLTISDELKSFIKEKCRW